MDMCNVHNQPISILYINIIHVRYGTHTKLELNEQPLTSNNQGWKDAQPTMSKVDLGQSLWKSRFQLPSDFRLSDPVETS